MPKSRKSHIPLSLLHSGRHRHPGLRRRPVLPRRLHGAGLDARGAGDGAPPELGLAGGHIRLVSRVAPRRVCPSAFFPLSPSPSLRCSTDTTAHQSITHARTTDQRGPPGPGAARREDGQGRRRQPLHLLRGPRPRRARRPVLHHGACVSVAVCACLSVRFVQFNRVCLATCLPHFASPLLTTIHRPHCTGRNLFEARAGPEERGLHHPPIPGRAGGGAAPADGRGQGGAVRCAGGGRVLERGHLSEKRRGGLCCVQVTN